MMETEMRVMGKHQRKKGKEGEGSRDIEIEQKEGKRERERCLRKDHSKTIPLMLFQADQVSGKTHVNWEVSVMAEREVEFPFCQPSSEVGEWVAGGGTGGEGNGGVCYKNACEKTKTSSQGHTFSIKSCLPRSLVSLGMQSILFSTNRCSHVIPILKSHYTLKHTVILPS